MRFAKTLAVATGLSLGLYTDATFSTRCDSNEDCAVGTICVDVGFPRGNPLNGAVCVQGCAKSDDCDNNCCATHVTPPSCANPDFYQGFTGACYSEDGCDCRGDGECIDGMCKDPDRVYDDPHMVGLRGQKINWSGIDGGWYSLIRDMEVDLHVNVRLTAPLPDQLPDYQFVTGLSVISEGHSLSVEVKDPYQPGTDGCPQGIPGCLAKGGLRVIVDNREVNSILLSSRDVSLGDGAITLSASGVPINCRTFEGHQSWAHMYEERVEGQRVPAGRETFEDWMLSFDDMVHPESCAKFVAEYGLANYPTIHTALRIETATAALRLKVGISFRSICERDGVERVLNDVDYWTMTIGLEGLSVHNPNLSGIMGETAHPVYDEAGREVLQGLEAFRGVVEDYRVSGALGTHFAFLDKVGDGEGTLSNLSREATMSSSEIRAAETIQLDRI